MRRALVTGATGGLGLALTRQLLDGGYAVRATGRDRSAAERLRVMGAEVITADLVQDPSAAVGLCAGVQVVFHAAALSSPWGTDAAFEAANIHMTRSLLDAARSAGCEGLVFVSSPSVYAERRDRLGLTEADPPAKRPLNAYARTKLAAERLVLAANRPGFFTVAIRPRAIVGPDDRVLVPRLVALVDRGRAPLPGGGDALVELTDVRDAAAALVRAGERASALGGRVFNISGGAPSRVRDIAQDLAEARGTALRIIPAPRDALYAAAILVEAIARLSPGRPEPPLTGYGVATLAYSQTFDLTAAHRDLGYAPRHDARASAMQFARTAGRGGGA